MSSVYVQDGLNSHFFQHYSTAIPDLEHRSVFGTEVNARSIKGWFLYSSWGCK